MKLIILAVLCAFTFAQTCDAPCGTNAICKNGTCACDVGYAGNAATTCLESCAACWDYTEGSGVAPRFLFSPTPATDTIRGACATCGNELLRGGYNASQGASADCLTCCPFALGLSRSPCFTPWWFDYEGIDVNIQLVASVMNSTGVCGERLVFPTACGCNNGKKDTFETDIDCGGPVCQTKCAEKASCKIAGDCTTGICGANGLCAGAKTASNWKGALGAFVAVVSSFFVALAIATYFLWWRDLNVGGEATKKDLEMNTLNNKKSPEPKEASGGAAVPSQPAFEAVSSDAPHAEDDVYVS